MLWLAAAVISTLHFDDAITTAGGDYLVIPFDVPAGTVEIQIDHTDNSDSDILDWGVWAPEGFRGWAGGLTDPAIIGVDESSRGYLPGAITSGSGWQIVIGKAKLPTGAGTYTIDVTFRDAETLTPVPRGAFDPVVLESTPRWYAGDLHVHSEQSGDAAATLDEIVTLAKSRGLDFVVVTDHNTIAHHALLAAAQPSLSDFLLVRGIEVTTYGGHGNAIGVSSYVDHRVGLGGVSAQTIADDVVAQGGVFTVNHPQLDLGNVCIGCAWVQPDTPWDEVSALEVMTGPYDVSSVLFTPRVLEMWEGLLDQGFAIGAVGGSDDHRAGMMENNIQSEIGSPTTMVFASELSEAGIEDGIRAGHTFVKLRGPDDPMVELTADGGAQVGDTVTDVGRVHLSAHVTGGDGDTLEIWHDGEKLESAPITGADATLTYDYPVTGARERYRAQVVEGGSLVTITSHLFVMGDPSLADSGCGCRTTGTGDTGLVVLVLACGRWRRRKQNRR